MSKNNHRSLKNKRDSQQFLQYGIGEKRFKMILLNEPNQPLAPILPSEFKPLSTSTPKRSRKSFKANEKSSVTTLSQFIGDIPNSSERNQKARSSYKKKINFDKPTSISKSFETLIVENEITTVHVKHQRSTSCESWDSFQKNLRHILNTTVRDLNIAEKNLKLICQFNASSKKNERQKHTNSDIFENYVKIKALRKASENIDDWKVREELEKCKPEQTSKYLKKNIANDITSTDNLETQLSPQEDFDKVDQLSSKNVESFKVHEVPHFTKSVVESSSNDCEIITADDLTTKVNKRTQPSTAHSNTRDDILNFTLEFDSSLNNSNPQKHQANESFNFFENVFDSKDLTMVSKTNHDFSIFNRTFHDSIENVDIFDDFMMSSENCASFMVPETSSFSTPSKLKNSYFKTKRIGNPCFKLNETLDNDNNDLRDTNSQFEEALQKFLKTTKEEEVGEALLFAKTALNPPSKDIEVNFSTTSGNGKPLLSTSYDINTINEILKLLSEFDASSNNDNDQKNHYREHFENFVDTNVSNKLSETIDGLSILKEIFSDYIDSD